jgi:hypothetical protein
MPPHAASSLAGRGGAGLLTRRRRNRLVRVGLDRHWLTSSLSDQVSSGYAGQRSIGSMDPAILREV